MSTTFMAVDLNDHGSPGSPSTSTCGLHTVIHVASLARFDARLFVGMWVEQLTLRIP